MVDRYWARRMTPVQEADYWDYVCGDSKRIEAELWSDLNVSDCLEAVQPLKGQVFEIGCGVGRLTCPISGNVDSIYGVDVSPRMVELARRLCTARNATFVIGDGRTLEPGWSSTFDQGYSMTTFQHIPHDAQQGYLHEIKRVLVDGGRFRLQFVFEGEEAPFNYPTPVKDLLRWCDQAGLRETDVTLGRIKAEWAWITLVKP
jgi:SAM-dependent methyltransferase